MYSAIFIVFFHANGVSALHVRMAELRMPQLLDDNDGRASTAEADASADERTQLGWAMIADARQRPGFRELVEREYGKIINGFKLEHQCRACRRMFTLWESVGTQSCRRHPGTFSHTHRWWSCCQRHRSNPASPTFEKLHQDMGCTRADHESSYFDNVSGLRSVETVRIPLPVAAIMPRLDTRQILHIRRDYRVNPYLTAQQLAYLAEARQAESSEVIFEIRVNTGMQRPEFAFGAEDMCNYVVEVARIADVW